MVSCMLDDWIHLEDFIDFEDIYFWKTWLHFLYYLLIHYMIILLLDLVLEDNDLHTFCLKKMFCTTWIHSMDGYHIG